MPTPYIEKLAKEGKGTVKELEAKWDKAKKLAADQGHTDEYDYITGVFKKMVKANADEVQSAFMGVDMTLFIRLLEVAREELKTDEALHRLAERCSQLYAMKGEPLTMYDYEAIMSVLPTPTPETPEYSEASVVPKALARLEATSSTQEVSGTVQDAAVAIEKCFAKRKLGWTTKAKKGDTWADAHVSVKGNTSLGRVDFDCYLSKDGKDLVLDFWSAEGLYDFDLKVKTVLDKMKFYIGAGTSLKNLQKSELDAGKISKVRYDIDEIMADAEDIHEKFFLALEDIKKLMVKNS